MTVIVPLIPTDWPPSATMVAPVPKRLTIRSANSSSVEW